MMNWSEEQIAMAEECGCCHFDHTATANIILPTDPETAIEALAGESEIAQAYNKRKLLSEMKVRKAVFQLAENGSGPAQALALDIIRTNKLKSV